VEHPPNKLKDVRSPPLAPGGTVSNVGLSLSRLGASARLVGKIGDDHFGRILLIFYRERDPALADGMIITPGEVTSYSVVISPPGSDRIFLHCSGANHTFSAADLLAQSFDGAAILHFGYPPLMRGMYRDGGADLAAPCGKPGGVACRLDMALPDPAPAGRGGLAGATATVSVRRRFPTQHRGDALLLDRAR
jgi:hypothetical protein